jgi:hypothetical protein
MRGHSLPWRRGRRLSHPDVASKPHTDVIPGVFCDVHRASSLTMTNGYSRS